MLKKIYSGLLLFVLFVWIYIYFRNKIQFDWITPHYIDNTMIIVSTLILTYIITKIADIFLRNSLLKVLKGKHATKKIFPIFHNILMITLWIIGLLTGLTLLWYNILTLLTWAWIWWILLALAWKEAFMNFVWSIMLIFNKNFEIDDTIRVFLKKNYEWVVDEISLNYTKLVDKNWNIIYIPNKNILAETVENLSKYRFKMIELNFNLWKIKSESMEAITQNLEKQLKKEPEIENFSIDLDIKDYNLILNINLKIDGKANLTKIRTKMIYKIYNEIEKQWALFDLKSEIN